MNITPKRHPEAVSSISQATQEGSALYAAFAEARQAKGTLPLGRAIEAYRDFLKQRGYSAHSLRSVDNILSAFYRASDLNALTPLVAVTPEKAETTIRRLVGRHAPSTAWSYAIRIMAIFRLFAAAGILLENPFALIDPPRRPKLLPGPVLSRDEMRTLLAVPDPTTPTGLRNRALLEFFYSTAIRLSECANVKLGDVDFEKGIVLIRAGKGAKDRMVPVGEEAALWLKRYLAEVRPRFVTDGTVDALWMGLLNRPLGTPWIQRTISRLGRAAGLQTPVTPHTLRRTCVTHLLAAGASAWMVKEILGHADAKSLGRYLRIMPQEIKHVHAETHPRA